MLKQVIAFGLLALLLFNDSHAIDEFSIEGRVGYFVFASDKMRDVYSDGGFEVGVSATYPLCDIWNLYASLGFIEAWGKSPHFREKTTFRQIPLDVGIKPVIAVCSNVDWYMAIGPRFYYAQQHNDSDFVSKRLHRSGVGLFVNSGFDFYQTCNYSFNVFGEYSYQPSKPSSKKEDTYRKSVQIGGFAVGGGMGYTF